MLCVMETGNDAGGSKAGGRLALLFPTMPSLSPSSLWSKVAQNYICPPASGKEGGEEERIVLHFKGKCGNSTRYSCANPISSYPCDYTAREAGKWSALLGGCVDSHNISTQGRWGAQKWGWGRGGGQHTVLVTKGEGHKGNMLSLPKELTYPNHSPITALPRSAKRRRREKTRRQRVTQGR